MNQQQLLDHAQATFDECLKIMREKNSDYSKSDTDAFSNFKHASLVGVSPERAILVRVTDKMARLSVILDKDKPAVADETLSDTLSDIINYLAILKAMIEVK